MNRLFRSIAMIQQLSEDCSKWFCVWDKDRGYFDFVSGDRRPQETFRECTARSVRETLHFGERDFLVSNMAQLNSEFEAILPFHSEPSHVAVAFYIVNLYSKASKSLIRQQAENRWLTSAELLDGKTCDNLSVSPILKYLLHRSRVIQRWT